MQQEQPDPSAVGGTMNAYLAARLAAPYLAVGLFWCVLSNGWMAILAYHAQILFWSRTPLPVRMLPRRRRVLLYALPAAVAGPLMYVLLPHMLRTDLAAWLAAHRLSGPALLWMIPYFGLVHPLLEQLHWGPLRQRTPWTHALFAGYHMLVLSSLVSLPWLAFSFAALAAVSMAWQAVGRRGGGLATPVVSHVLADLGLILAAWLLVS